MKRVSPGIPALDGRSAPYGIDKVRKMDAENNLLGCFVSETRVAWDNDQKTVDAEEAKGDLFCTYIWGPGGICDTLKTLHNQDYGQDLVLILFEFYVFPTPDYRAYYGEIGRYRKKERSIGIPIFVDDDNFFSKTEAERRRFLRQSVLGKLLPLEKVVKRRKLDTDMAKLKTDLERILAEW